MDGLDLLAVFDVIGGEDVAGEEKTAWGQDAVGARRPSGASLRVLCMGGLGAGKWQLLVCG